MTWTELKVGRFFLAISWSILTLSTASVSFAQDDERSKEPTPSETEKPSDTSSQVAGGERLSSKEVSELPLNKRDFSQLLLLAAGTMTDANGAANYTQQFAVNGQRGTTTVFAMDGIDTTDPQMGGATFSNFNVDAIQEIRSLSGVMPAEIGHGAAGYTEILTRSGTDLLHGSVFEFLRNAAFDARNFFDRRTLADPGRLPHFVRNEFGFTLGGPVVLPGFYNGRKKTHFFGQYQGFRQVLGTTEVFPVPSIAERAGMNTTTFPGDTLFVPIDPRIAPVLEAYPAPNDPHGPFGVRTYAASSKVSTFSDQFSVRVDHVFSDKARLLTRFSWNNVDGPLTNPSQTAIDPSFAIRFLDRQRNGGFQYTRTVTPNFVVVTTAGVMRSTPLFPPLNRTQPALRFGDGLYEAFNGPGGTTFGAYTGLLQLKQDFLWSRRTHQMKWGTEVRINRDTTIAGYGPNGRYIFGGGRSYSPVAIPSASGLNDIAPGDPLPDALTSLLTATPFSYLTGVAPPYFPQGERIGESGVRREAYNFYYQDTWMIHPRLSLEYGLRYEVNARIHEASQRTHALRIVNAEGQPAASWEPGVRARHLVNPQPAYAKDWRGWGPRLALSWRWSHRTVLRAGGAITTLLPNLWQQNFSTSGFPYVYQPYITASPGAPVDFQNSVAEFDLPRIFTTSGEAIYETTSTADVPGNTEIDVQRFQEDIAAMTPGNQIVPLTVNSIEPEVRNGYIGSYTAGFETLFQDIELSAAYVATVGVKIPGIQLINGYAGADPSYSPLATRDDMGNITGGYSAVYAMSSRSHSTYHGMQASARKTSERWGGGFLVSYTLSKSLDDHSAVQGGYPGLAPPILQAFPQDPRNPGLEKGLSTFDATHVLTVSWIQRLPFDRARFLQPLGPKLTTGWRVLSIATLMSGPPFTVFSGIQQTGAGSGGADRPDQVGQPEFSTRREVREDYFGQGSANADFFSIPIGVPGGTGPNQGRAGTLGRSTFRGPGFTNLDISLMKDTSFGRRGNAEAMTLQFRAEVFNVFNLVNFGLPLNVVRGSGFGLINKTQGSSRQIQFSLKLIF